MTLPAGGESLLPTPERSLAMRLLSSPQLPEEKTKDLLVTSGVLQLHGRSGERRVCHRSRWRHEETMRTARCSFRSSVARVSDRGDLTSRANLSKFHGVFFVAWRGLNTRCSLREDGFHAEKLVRSFSVSLFFKIADFAILLTGIFGQRLCSKGGEGGGISDLNKGKTF